MENTNTRFRASKSSELVRTLLNQVGLDTWTGHRIRVRFATSYTPTNLTWWHSRVARTWFVSPGLGLASMIDVQNFKISHDHAEGLEGVEMPIPTDRVLVEHSFFMGNDEGVTIYVPPPADQKSYDVAVDCYLSNDRVGPMLRALIHEAAGDETMECVYMELVKFQVAAMRTAEKMAPREVI